ncbi:MAG: ABC transporter ATP-binding protein, partial [Candidatus Rokubacteria bacterium]|nr:ABC transporter ATP-binding protein [Candidatus Rokubacteria bacterium]
LLREAAAQGRSVVIVTHDHRVAPWVDRTVLLEDGRLVA